MLMKNEEIKLMWIDKCLPTLINSLVVTEPPNGELHLPRELADNCLHKLYASRSAKSQSQVTARRSGASSVGRGTNRRKDSAVSQKTGGRGGVNAVGEVRSHDRKGLTAQPICLYPPR